MIIEGVLQIREEVPREIDMVWVGLIGDDTCLCIEGNEGGVVVKEEACVEDDTSDEEENDPLVARRVLRCLLFSMDPVVIALDFRTGRDIDDHGCGSVCRMLVLKSSQYSLEDEHDAKCGFANLP